MMDHGSWGQTGQTITTILMCGRIFDTSPGMAHRPRVVAPGLLYDVIARGNQQRKTFRGDDDYKAYTSTVWNTTAPSSTLGSTLTA
jgi:hypothetical protein